MLINRFIYIICIVFCLFSISCERERGSTIDVNYSAPFVRSASLNVSYLHLDTTKSGAVTQLPNGTYKIAISLNAQIKDPYGAYDIKQVSYHVYAPASGKDFLLGQLESKVIGPDLNEATYSGNITFIIDRSESGQYRIEVYAQSQSAVASNALLVSLLIAKNSGPPHLSNLSAPDTIIRPTSGFRNVFFAMTVSDPDGLADIDKVFFRSITSSNPNYEHPLYDDGNLAVTGDSVAHDGRFSRIIPIDSSATLGTKLFRFYARDKSGVQGDSINHYLTIVAP